MHVLFDDRRGVFAPFTGIGHAAELLCYELQRESSLRLTLVSSLGLKGANAGLTAPTFVRKLYFDQVALPLRVPRNVDVYHALYHEASPLTVSPLVVNVYDLSILTSASSFSIKQRAYYGGLLRVLARRSRIVIVPSYWTERDVRTWRPQLMIRVVPCPVEPLFFESVPDDAVEVTLTKLGLEAGRYLLYSGGLHARKSLRVLVEGVALAQRRGGVAGPLVLTGSPDPTARELAGRARCDAKFTGVLERKEMRDLYAGCAAVVSASVNEGFGYSAAEGAAMGRPVVCPDRGALAETAGLAATTFRAGDQRGLADALDVAGERGNNGCGDGLMEARIEAQRFAPVKVAQKLVSCYQEAAC